MTYIERAIEDAVENGCEMRRDDWHWSESEDAKKIYRLGIFLDPLFWQSLGKARGWSSQFEIMTGLYEEGIEHGLSGKVVYKWEYEWHRFIDHLAEGGDAESFFEEIYKT